MLNTGDCAGFKAGERLGCRGRGWRHGRRSDG
jgi:hypothetical protein